MLGIYSVAFDASTVVFPLYGVRATTHPRTLGCTYTHRSDTFFVLSPHAQLVYKATGFSLQSFFIAYSSISIIVVLCAVMWPLALSTQETIKEVEGSVHPRTCTTARTHAQPHTQLSTSM